MTEAIDEMLKPIKEYIHSAHDKIHFKKMEQVIEKAKSEKIFLTFCGHFSAGKSSLINYLCGHTLLPSSPIPTSANLVSIQNGQEGAWIKRREGAGGQLVSIDQLNEYSVNGKEVESIEISYPIPLLQDSLTLIDTPGIDSTDDAHYQSTETALHLADVIFYVMDYNHVQSQVNFNFLKRVQEWGKPFYLLINQIDKHKQQEISFDNYCNEVKRAFHDVDIQPNGFLFISLRDRNHLHNELKKLEWLIQEFPSYKKALKEVNAKHSAQQIVKEHIQWMAERNEEIKAEYRNNDMSEEQYALLTAKLDQLRSEANEVKQLSEKMNLTFKGEIRALLDNANIIPAVTRDLIHYFLQSCQRDFKVGLLFTANKTKAEQINRLTQFHRDISEQMQAHIEWHLQDLLRKQASLAGIASETLTHAIGSLKINITPEWLKGMVQSSSVFSNEYTMNYAKQISSEIKNLYRKQAVELVDQMIISLENKSKEQLKIMDEQISLLCSELEMYYKLNQMEQKEELYADELNRLVDWSRSDVTLPNLTEQMGTLEHPKTAELDDVTRSIDTTLDQKDQISSDLRLRSDLDAITTRFAKDKLRGRLLKTSEILKKAYECIGDLPAMDNLIKSLKEKSRRLEGSQFTIALFGAFSAGKSSFANALLGENILPVSPNPTTAAINKITSPPDGYAHGTAKVRMKTGEERLVDLQEFKEYAANESKSRLVDSIELYYSCPFTDAGFILVDTPGADSMNARHTRVAFEYIKNADIILFVTYYNHAFSQADREFLLQLGRVKDSFEMDKMFFIINAADLAASNEELQQVVQHLETNLLQYGIRQPRIYSVSSQMALEGKRNKASSMIQASGIHTFEQDFVRFTSDELLELAVQSANLEIRRTIQTLEDRIMGAQEGELERADKVLKLEQSSDELIGYIHRQDYGEELRAIKQEIEELIFYIKQRVFYRFNEMYQISFNPSGFRDQQIDVKKALISAWEDLVRTVSFNCSQEIWATTLRIENFINKIVKQRYEETNQNIKEKINIYNPEPYRTMEMAAPEFNENLDSIEMDVKWLQGYFKNAKHFFEGEGKSRLKEQLEDVLTLPVGNYLEQQSVLLTEYYRKQCMQKLEKVAEMEKEMLHELVKGYISALQMNINVDDLLERKVRLQHLIV